MREIRVRNDGESIWKSAVETGFKDEAHLQQLLYEDPGLIPFADLGEEFTAPKVYVREAGLPGSGNTDLIGVDETGGIAVIECKLATNPEQKRKVLGQVLEYAAFLWRMNYGRFERLFQKEVSKAGKGCLADLVAPDGDEDWSEADFRANVESTLESGDFCLIVAVDSLNDELRKTIEYLTRRAGRGTTIYAVEVGYFRGDGFEALSPRLVGSRDQPPPPPREGWNEDKFFEAASRRSSAATVALLKRLYEFTRAEGDRVVWGRGRVEGSFTFRVERAGGKASAFNALTNGSLWLNFESMKTNLGDGAADRFANSLSRLDGMADLDARLETTHWPTYKVEDVFAEAGALEAFEEAVRELRDGAGK